MFNDQNGYYSVYSPSEDVFEELAAFTSLESLVLSSNSGLNDVGERTAVQPSVRLYLAGIDPQHTARPYEKGVLWQLALACIGCNFAKPDGDIECLKGLRSSER